MPDMPTNPQVDDYLKNGCMRCPYGGTDKCKVHLWTGELKRLRQIVLATGLHEEIKWGVPVYTHQGKNIVTVNALKASANLGFFKGVLLTDSHNILQQQGSLQSDRLIKFTAVDDISKVQDILTTYIKEAIAIEDSGKKVVFNKTPEPMPDELLDAFAQDPAFEQAFCRLSAGRQRGYVIYFSKPKQSATKVRRIEQYKSQILNGMGLHDK